MYERVSSNVRKTWLLIFVFLLFVALVYVWRRGALDWK